MEGKGDGHHHGRKNLTRMQQAHYFHDINYYMLKKINRRPEGGGHRSMSTPVNTPLLLKYKEINDIISPAATKALVVNE